MIMSSEQRAAHVAELADALASGASEVTLVQVQVLSWALQVVKGLTANRRESFFHWPMRLGGKLGGRIGFTLGLSRLPFRRESRTEVEAWLGWKNVGKNSCWSFG